MLNVNFKPFPILTSSRLNFRKITNDDAPEIFLMRSNKEVMKFIPRPTITTIDEALAHIKLISDKIEENIGINWAITEKLSDNNKLIGIIGHFKIDKDNYRSEIGYMLLPEYHNKGYITEAIATMIHYGFNTLNLHSIEAIIDPENKSSEKVLQKNNFVKEAHFKENEFYNGKFLDTVIYSIINKENKL